MKTTAAFVVMALILAICVTLAAFLKEIMNTRIVKPYHELFYGQIQITTGKRTGQWVKVTEYEETKKDAQQELDNFLESVSARESLTMGGEK